VRIRLMSQMGERKDNLLNVEDAEAITSKDFSLNKVKAPGLHITSKRRIQ